MNIAFIENDVNFHEIVKELTKIYANEWNIKFYKDVASMNGVSYDVIIANTTDKKLIKRISSNSAEFALIVDDIMMFLDEDLLNDPNVGALIDKNDLDDLLEWLQYFHAKISINKIFDFAEGAQTTAVC